MVGRDKIRMNDLKAILAQCAKDGWRLAAFVADADIRGERDGHLLIFREAVPEHV